MQAMAGSEMLAEPLVSRSVPFELLFASMSSEVEKPPPAASAADAGGGTAIPRGTRSQAMSIESPSAPDSLQSIQSQTFSGTRRFLSVPAAESSKSLDAGSAADGYQGRQSRVSLSRWYERMSTSNMTAKSRTLHHNSGSGRLRRTASPKGSPTLHSQSLPQRLSDGGKLESLSEEMARLRAALRSERHARRAAEAQVTSLENALENSQQRVDSQEQRLMELTAKLTETRAAIAPVHEILAIAERNFHRKELTLRRIVMAQQEAEGHRQTARVGGSGKLYGDEAEL